MFAYGYVGNNPINFDDPDGLEERVSSASLRKQWETTNNKPWPKDPATGWNQDVSHKQPLADGGTNSVCNIEPKPRKEHINEHVERGDFKRWGARTGLGNKLGVLIFADTLLNAADAQRRAEKYGISIWTVMSYDLLGIPVNENTLRKPEI